MGWMENFREKILERKLEKKWRRALFKREKKENGVVW